MDCPQMGINLVSDIRLTSVLIDTASPNDDFLRCYQSAELDPFRFSF